MCAHRVVITGLGMISALGENVPDTWAAVHEGRSGIAPLPSFGPAPLRFYNGARVAQFSPAAHFSSEHAHWLDRFAQFAIVAAREAVRDASVAFTPRLAEETAVITGSSMGGQATLDEGFSRLYREGHARVDSPLIVPRGMANAGACHIAMEFGITGPTFTLSTACCSANHAIGQAFWMVRNGTAKMAITGASEAPFSYGLLKAFEAMRIVSPDTCRPFSRGRRGLILGEGSAMIVLESLESARARGAAVYAEIAGFGMSSDAQHLTRLSKDGPIMAMRKALRDAGTAPEEVGYINAHGSGTPINDSMETLAIRELFGPHADRLAISSTKALHGHALGATGAFEAVCTVLALKHGCLPPTVNYTDPDPECDLDVVPNRARPSTIKVALSNSFAFGGLNSVLAFRRAE